MIKTTNEVLIKTLVDLKWKDGFTCRKCGHKLFKAGTKTEGGRKCKKCDTEESLKRYTVFDNSKIPLGKAYELMEYLISTCYFDEKEKWFIPGRLAEDGEKHLFEQRLTLDEFFKRKNKKIEETENIIANMDAFMNKWANTVEENMSTYKKQYKSRTEFENAKLFKPIPKMLPTAQELISGISYLEFLDRANVARHKLQLTLEGQEASLERRINKFFMLKKPSVAKLARKFDLEENTISAFLKKIHERLKCFYFFNSTIDSTGKGDHYDDIAKFLKESNYSITNYFSLFMFPLTQPIINGETRIEKKWYRFDEGNGDWQLRQIHFVKKDRNGQSITYYNKPGEEEYICSNPEEYEGPILEIPFN